MAAQLTEGQIDLILTAQATGAGELAFDFTQSYYITYLALAERPDCILWRLFQAFISPTFFNNRAAGIIGLLVVVGSDRSGYLSVSTMNPILAKGCARELGTVFGGPR